MPVKNTPSPLGGDMIYQILSPEPSIDPEKSRIFTPFSIYNVLCFLIMFGSVGSEVISGRVVPERR